MNATECHAAMTAGLVGHLKEYVDFFCYFIEKFSPQTANAFDTFVNMFSNVDNGHGFCNGDMIFICSEEYYRLIGPNYLIIASIPNEETFVDSYLGVIFNLELARRVFDEFHNVYEGGVIKIKWWEYDFLTEMNLKKLTFAGFAKFTLERRLIGEFPSPMIFKSVLYKFYKRTDERMLEKFINEVLGRRQSDCISNAFHFISQRVIRYWWREIGL